MLEYRVTPRRLDTNVRNFGTIFNPVAAEIRLDGRIVRASSF
jgi:hypothetical protein